MSTPHDDDAQILRSAIEGRATFGAAAVAVGAGLVALLGRVGAPDRIVSALGPALALVALATLGVLVRSMRVSRFYAAGREQPAAFAALAFAALAAGLFLPFAPPASGSNAFHGVMLGFSIGLALAALAGGPLLRKTGALSLSDLLSQRFPSVALRLAIIALVAVTGALAGLAGAESAARALSASVGVSQASALALIGVALILVATPGGLAGVVWSAAGACVLLIIGLGLPSALLVGGGERPPLPFLGDSARWSAALERVAALQPTIDAPFVDANAVAVFALGLAAFAPLLAPAIATLDRRAAQRAGLAGLGWCVVLALILAAALATATLALGAAVDGLRLDQAPSLLFESSGRGLLKFCGASAPNLSVAQKACAAAPGFAGVLRASDVAASGEFLLIISPALRGFGAALSGFAAAGLVCAGFALAAAGVHTLGVALGQDLLHRLRSAQATTSRRLAVTRAVFIAATICGVLLLAARPLDPRVLIGAALALSAATLTPLLLLSLWPRAEPNHAAIALLAALATGETMLIAEGAASFEQLAKAALFACGAGFAAGVGASFLRKADPMSRGAAFLNGVLHGDSDVLAPDKGA